MNHEDEQLKKRWLDLSEQAYQCSCYTFTDFLSLPEQSYFLESKKALYNPPYTLFGGQEGCERQIIRFGNPEELGYEVPFPITCIEIKPLSEKFAEYLTHRDYLGALINLGIERKMIGDILIHEKTAIVFVCEKISVYIIGNLEKIKHTNVSASIAESVPNYMRQELERKELIVPSERLDAVVARFTKLSRSRTGDLFREKRVFCNGRVCENEAHKLTADDVVTVRGYGKFYYRGVRAETRKEKLCIQIEVYRAAGI